MKKTVSLALCALLALGLLAGCGGKKPLPEGMDSETLTAEATTILDSMIAEDYDALAEAFDSPEITAELLAGQIRPTLEKLGAFKDYGKIETLGVEENGVEYATALVECVFENGKSIWSVSYTTGWKLGGLRLVG